MGVKLGGLESLGLLTQGQRTLSTFSCKDLHQEVNAQKALLKRGRRQQPEYASKRVLARYTVRQR